MKLFRGFSLAELLVCMSALIPILLILVGAFPFAHQMSTQGWERLDAQDVARDQLEQLRSADFDTLVSHTLTETRGPQTFTVDVQIVPDPPGQTTVIQKRATLTITWPGHRGLQTLSLATLIYRWAQQ